MRRSTIALIVASSLALGAAGMALGQWVLSDPGAATTAAGTPLANRAQYAPQVELGRQGPPAWIVLDPRDAATAVAAARTTAPAPGAATEDDENDPPDEEYVSEPEDPLIKMMKNCEAGNSADYDCIAIAIRHRDQKRLEMLRQALLLEATESVLLLALTNVASTKRMRFVGADSVEVAGLQVKLTMRLNQAREVVVELRRQTALALDDKDDP